jgi:hypothetical protein
MKVSYILIACLFRLANSPGAPCLRVNFGMVNHPFTEIYQAETNTNDEARLECCLYVDRGLKLLLDMNNTIN